MSKVFANKIIAPVVSFVFVLSLVLSATTAQAATLTGGSVSLSSSAISASSTTYTLTFSGVTTSAIKCIKVRFTDTLGSDSKPTGMNVTSAALSNSSNYIPTPASWSVSNNNTTGVSSITYATGETPASASSRTVILSGITNGSTKNTTYYVEVNTFNNTDCSSSAVDSGSATFVLTEGVAVSGTVNPTMTFSLTDTSCSLGTLSSSATGSCSHTMAASTNASSGYTIAYLAGATLTSGLNTIAAIGATAATSSTGTAQFGLNLMNNATPNVGADPTGGSGAAATNYDTADSYAFSTSGATVASASSASATTTYTVSYIANIASTTKAGSYSTTVVYNVTANY